MRAGCHKASGFAKCEMRNVQFREMRNAKSSSNRTLCRLCSVVQPRRGRSAPPLPSPLPTPPMLTLRQAARDQLPAISCVRSAARDQLKSLVCFADGVLLHSRADLVAHTVCVASEYEGFLATRNMASRGRALGC